MSVVGAQKWLTKCSSDMTVLLKHHCVEQTLCVAGALKWLNKCSHDMSVLLQHPCVEETLRVLLEHCNG